jgi:hypothetical protein
VSDDILRPTEALKNSPSPEIQTEVAKMGEDLRAKDEAALAEFKASLHDGVENARAAIPGLAKSVSTMALLLSTTLPAQLKDQVRPMLTRASERLGEIERAAARFDSLTINDTLYPGSQATAEYIKSQVSGIRELLEEIDTALSGLSVTLAEGVVLTITIAKQPKVL